MFHQLHLAVVCVSQRQVHIVIIDRMVDADLIVEIAPIGEGVLRGILASAFFRAWR